MSALVPYVAEEGFELVGAINKAASAIPKKYRAPLRNAILNSAVSLGARAGSAVSNAVRNQASALVNGPNVSYDPFARNKAPDRSKATARTKSVPQSSAVIVSQPVSRSVIVSQRAPNYSHNRDGSIVISHREYVGDIIADPAGNFGIYSYSLNPANANIFPWLMQIAVNYDTYTFEHLSFDYETCASTSSPGCVLMAIDYDPSDVIPGSKQQIMSYDNAKRTPIWQPVKIAANVKALNRGFEHFVSSTGGSSDPTVAGGYLYVATMGTSTATAGELYVCYRVKLSNPQQAAAPGISQSLHAVYTSGGLTTPFFTASSFSGGNSSWANQILAGVAMISSVNSLTCFAAGQWLVTLMATGTASTNTAPTITALQSAVVTTIDGGAWNGSPATSNLYRFKVTTYGNRGQGFSVNYTGSLTTLTAIDVRISPYNASI